MSGLTSRVALSLLDDPRAACNPVGFAGSLQGQGLKHVPGPTGRPWLGLLPEFRRDPFTLLRDLGEQYGDVVRLPMPVWNVVVVRRPDQVGQFMNDPTTYSMYGPMERVVRMTMGSATPFLEGDVFRQRRRLIMPMFGRASLVELAGPIADEFTRRLDAWQAHADTGGQIDLQHEIAAVTMPAFLRAMFSITPTADEIAMLDYDLRSFMRLVSSLFFLNAVPNPVPLPGMNSLAKSLWRTRRWIDAHIQCRLAQSSKNNDLLQVLLDARYEDGTPISRKDVITECLVLIAGGYETVVASLSWTLALLAENPEPYARLIDEIDQLDGRAPTYDDLERLDWTKACFDEGQRLQGHPFHPRLALKDDVIDGCHIPKWSVVTVSMYALHRDPRWWDNPDVYDPMRFYDKEVVKARPNLAFIPFGAGPHRCVGAALAYMNAQFLLALIHQRFRVSTPTGWHPRHASTFSCTIQGGLPVTLSTAQTTSRRASAPSTMSEEDIA